MKFTSTRSLQSLTSAEAISRGIASDGGLFVPENFPPISPESAKELCTATYKERAEKILAGYLTDFTAEEIRKCVEGAYTETFENEHYMAQHLLQRLDGNLYIKIWCGENNLNITNDMEIFNAVALAMGKYLLY